MSPAQLLVVDDQAHIRRIVRMGMERAGHEVREACDGRDALEQIRAARPDLVISDMQMPELDGRGLCEQAKAEHGDDCPPIILLTAMPQDHCRWAETLCAAVVSKPVTVRALLPVVAEVLATHGITGTESV
jgi:CheY-like chemotaxis protein